MVGVTDTPYPGLRSFERDETHIFFGRESAINQMIARLAPNHFLAVTGSSGSGKSSLVRTGLFDGLERGLLAEAGSDWVVVDFRPGAMPMSALADALLEAMQISRFDQDVPLVDAILARGPLGLVEFLDQVNFSAVTNLLILVDQFEEIFRFRRGAARDDTEKFVGLLLASAAQRGRRIFVVITMRSDFLGDCAAFPGLAEAINDGQFLTTRLNRDQCRRAIEGPAAVFGGSVEPALATTLLNETGDNPDQLPLLQHALMRLWSRACTEDNEGEIRLTLDAYQHLGGDRDRTLGQPDLRFSGALSHHADEILEGLLPKQRRLAQTLFRCLTEGEGARGRDVRRPTTMAEVAEVANATVADLVPVVEAFRAPGRHFLTPPIGVRLSAKTTIDITHESLIRRWTTLQDWVRDETRSAETYRRLEDTANLWQNRQAELWTGADLATALAWKEQARPNPAWAARYGDNFIVAMRFLDESAAYEERRRSDAEAARQLAARAEADRRYAHRMRWVVSVAVLLAFIAAGCAVWVYQLEQDAKQHARTADDARERANNLSKRLVEDRQESSGREVETSLANGKVELARIIARGAAEVTGRPAGRLQRAMAGVFLSQGLGPLLIGTDGGTKLAVVDPKRRYVAGAIADGIVRLWDSSSGAVVRSLVGPPAVMVTALALAPDGNRLAAGFGDGSVRIWETMSGKLVRTLRGHRGDVVTIAFTAQGDRLASGGRDGNVRLWQLDQAEVAHILRPRQDPTGDDESAITVITFNQPGNLVVAGNRSGNVTIWNGDGNSVFEAKRSDPVTQMAFGVANNRDLALLTTDDGSYVLGPDETGKFDMIELKTWPGGLALKFDALSGEFVAAKDRTLWRIRAPKLSTRFREAVSAEVSLPGDIVAFESAAERLLLRSGSDDKLPLQLFSAPAPKASPIKLAKDQPGEGHILAVFDESVVITIGTTLRVFSIATGDLQREVSLSDEIVCSSFDEQGRRVALGLDNGKIAIFEIANLQQEATISESGHEARVLSIAFSRDGERLVTGSDDNIAIVWARDHNVPRELFRLQGHSDSVRGVAFATEDATVVSVSDDGTLRVWDANTGEQRTVDKLSEDSLIGLSLDTAGRRALVRTDIGPARIWDLEMRSLVAILPVAELSAAMFHGPADDILLATHDGRVTLWSSNADELLGTREAQGRVSLVSRGPELVEVAPDGAILFDSVERTLALADWTAVIAAGSSRGPTPDEQANYGWRLTSTKDATSTAHQTPCGVTGIGEAACVTFLEQALSGAEGWFDWAKFREVARGTNKGFAPTPDPRLIIAAAMGYPPALEQLGDWLADSSHRYPETAQSLYMRATVADRRASPGLFRWLMQSGDDVRAAADPLRTLLMDRASAGDAASHAVLGALAERSKEARQDLGEAFYHYAVAVRLAGDLSASWVREAWVRQGALARVIGPREAAERWLAAQRWTPEPEKMSRAPMLPAWRPDLRDRNLGEEKEIIALAIDGIDHLLTSSSEEPGLSLFRAELWSELAGRELASDHRDPAVEHLAAARQALENQIAIRPNDQWLANRLIDVLGELAALADRSERRALLAAKIETKRQVVDADAVDRTFAAGLGDDELDFASQLLDDGNTQPARVLLEDAALRFTSPARRQEWSDTQEFVARETRLGDALARLPDGEGALAAFGKALAHLDPAVQMLGVDNLTDDKAAALGSVQRSIIRLIRSSAAASSDLAATFRDIGYGFNTVGSYYVNKGDAAQASGIYLDALEIREWLVKSVPKQANIWRQIGIGYDWFPTEITLLNYQRKRRAVDALNHVVELDNTSQVDNVTLRFREVRNLYDAARFLEFSHLVEELPQLFSLLTSTKMVEVASHSSDEVAVAASEALRNLSILEGVLAGDVILTEKNGSVCDRTYGNPYDPQRRSKGVMLNDIVVPLDAISVCLGDDPVTVFELGRVYQKAGDNKAAFNQYIKAAKMGHIFSINNLSSLYTDPDIKRRLALKFFREIQLGFGAQLAVRFTTSESMAHDPPTAVQLLRDAAEWGDSNSHFRLSQLYAEGVIEPQDLGLSVYHGFIAARLRGDDELEQYLRTVSQLRIDAVELMHQEAAAYAWQPRPDPLPDFDQLPLLDLKK
jgi:WD40 repeat protein/TPR repeat protein